jgi:hypothetical protein
MSNQLLDPGPLTRPSERWDYCVISIHARNDTNLQEKLRELGRDGWELVAVDTPLAMEYHCIFKRRE